MLFKFSEIILTESTHCKQLLNVSKQKLYGLIKNYLMDLIAAFGVIKQRQIEVYHIIKEQSTHIVLNIAL